jgi:hypothetical protein
VSQTFTLHTNDANRPNVLANVHRFLDALPDGKAWKIEVAQYQKRRSDQQNRYLWGVVYAAFKTALPGWDTEDIHDYLLGEHFGWERLEGLDRTRLRPIKRSSKLGKQEFAEFVDFCIRKGAEHGIYVPPPEPGDFA